MAMFLL